MTKAQVKRKMDLNEFVEWLAYYELEHEANEQARKAAMTQANADKPRRRGR